MREAHVQSAIAIRWGRHPRVRLWRANAGNLFAKTTEGGLRPVQVNVPGIPDLYGWLSLDCSSRWWERICARGLWRPLVPDRVAVPLGIECKSDIGELNDNQKRFRQKMMEHGGVWLYARTVEMADSVLVPLVGNPPE